MTFPTRPTLRGTFGMVASTHWIASSAAFGVLERGGNAVDAAVCAGFVLHVVEPHLNGPGGDLPAIVAMASGAPGSTSALGSGSSTGSSGAGSSPDGRPRVLCGQGPAPAAATPQRLRELGFAEVPGVGPVAAAVPGAVDAWLVMLRDHGTLPLADVLAPALHYARHGAPLVPAVGRTVATVARLFEIEWPTSAALWLTGGCPPAPGALQTYPAWADTLERLVREGDAGAGTREQRIERARRAWGCGFVAEAVDRAGPIVTDGVAQPYLVRGSDMAAVEATWEEPATLSFRGFEIAKPGLWSQGPVLLQALGMLDALAAVRGDEVLDPGTPEGAHAFLEVLKLAMADREAWCGDAHDGGRGPDPALLADLLDPAYLAARAALVGPEASRDLRPGSPGGRVPRLARLVTDAAGVAGSAGRSLAGGSLAGTAGEPTVDARGRGDTCHVDVVDRWGNMVSATPSGGWLQSSPVIAELGFPLGTRLQMTWLEEGLASTLTPGRRPRTTLSPTMVLRDGRPWMACGTPGGDQQDQWQVAFLLRALAAAAGGVSRAGDGSGVGEDRESRGGGTEDPLDLQAAIDAPMLHSLSFPGSFWPRRSEPGVAVLEDRFAPELIADLERRGHEVRRSDPWSLGRLSAVTRDADGILQAAANPRGMQGYAVGR